MVYLVKKIILKEMHRDCIPISIDHLKNQHYSRTYLFSTISVKNQIATDITLVSQRSLLSCEKSYKDPLALKVIFIYSTYAQMTSVECYKPSFISFFYHGHACKHLKECTTAHP